MHVKPIYLVTGVSGFLGNHIATRLLAAGERVRGLVLPGDPAVRYLPEGVELITGDVTNNEDLDRFFTLNEGEEAIVIHCAGIISMSMKPVPLVYKVNVESVLEVGRYCLNPQIRKMLYVASVHAITEKPEGQVMAEPEKTDSDSVPGYYAKTKAEAVAGLMAMREKNGLKLNILYPSGMSGPGDYAKGNFTQLFIDYAAGHIPMGVKGGYNFVDIRDVADAIIKLSCQDLVGEDYVLAGEYISVKDILADFARILGRKPSPLVAPQWLAKLALPFFTLYYKVKKTKPVFSRYSLFTINTNSRFSSDKAKRELGFNPRPFRETIRDTMEWLNKQGMLKKNRAM
jgi:dihydroflavonol-4-reductase